MFTKVTGAGGLDFGQRPLKGDPVFAANWAALVQSSLQVANLIDGDGLPILPKVDRVIIPYLVKFLFITIVRTQSRNVKNIFNIILYQVFY